MAVDRKLQIIENRYIDRDKLMLHLEQTFGENNFAIRVRAAEVEDLPVRALMSLLFLQLQLNRWIMSLPRKLAEVRLRR